MPQITVNEIDQSVVTRVVSDDKVKILVPAILSFGPTFDETNNSVMTFTDLSAFNRGCGYTPAEFNPFEDDYSRIYARELLKKGAAISVVRVNNAGATAEFEIDGYSTDRNSPSYKTICPAVLASIPSSGNPDKVVKTDIELTGTGTAGSGTIPNITSSATIIPGTVSIKGELGTNVVVFYDRYNTGDTGKLYYINESHAETELGTINYTSGLISGVTGYNLKTASYSTISNAWKYTFCPQITGIFAKYPGSFGNNLFISISQITTSNLAESYQYANISVYYVEREINYAYNSETQRSEIKSQVVKNVTVLETKRVSTNPNDPYYFEDVEFDFIRIDASENAREQLGLVWSNIEGSPASNLMYSGFPTISLKYMDSNKSMTYNFYATTTKAYGTDFNYSNDLVEKLKSGFKGYNYNLGSTGSYEWSEDDVDEYITQVYDDPGIKKQILETISGVYGNFIDPYIYDFDFITSGGFVYEEYTTSTPILSGAYTVTEIAREGTETVTCTVTPNNNGIVKNTVSLSFKVGDENVPYSGTDDGSGNIKDGSNNNLAEINYSTGVIQFTVTGTSGSIKDVSVTYSYNGPKTSSVTYPEANGSGSSYYTKITPIHTQMLNLVNTRQDCIALFDVPKDYDKFAIIEYSAMLNTSYGTIHNPWCWVASPDISGINILMAPSYIFLYTFLQNLDNNVDAQKWFPPAGVKRATARVVKRPYYEIGSVILNAWQNDNISRVNPIMRLKQYGYVIYGQYTTLQAIDLYTHSALESLNVRLISNVVKKKIFDVCLNLAFEPNTSTLWLKFYSQMDEFLRYMQYNDGVYDYRIVMDESTVTTDDINHLRCPGKVYIAPTRTAEFFDIDFIITEAGARFNN